MNEKKSDHCFYNIALFPEDRQLIDDCVHFAQSNCADSAEQYLLGESAWPHITLCQFQAAPALSTEVWSKVVEFESDPVSIQFQQIYIMAARPEIYVEKYYVGLSVKPSPRLIKLQVDVFEQLLTLGINSLTSTENYFPHLTWALCHGQKPTITHVPPEKLWQEPHLFRVSLGRSDEHGVYHERLFP
jgi:2'-5' RNA ligase